MRARSASWVFGMLLLAACGGEIQPEDGSPSATPPTSTGLPPAPTTTTPPTPTPAPTPLTPPPAPLACPTTVTELTGAAGVVSTVALGTATYHLLASAALGSSVLLEGTWSGSTHSVSKRESVGAQFALLEPLGAETWAASEGFSDTATRKVVAYRGFSRLGSFEVPNVNRTRSSFKEGISPALDTVVFQNGNAVSRATVTLGKDNWERTATPLCVADCELLWAKGDDVLMVKHANGAPSVLYRRAFSNLATDAASATDETDGRAVAAVTKNRIFLDGSYDERAPMVLDRATLQPVPFTWEGYDDIRAVRERADGSFDVFSVYSGEIASAKHVSATGQVLAEGSGHAAYGFVTAGECGFWVDGSLFPYASTMNRR